MNSSKSWDQCQFKNLILTSKVCFYVIILILLMARFLLFGYWKIDHHTSNYYLWHISHIYQRLFSIYFCLCSIRTISKIYHSQTQLKQLNALKCYFNRFSTGHLHARNYPNVSAITCAFLKIKDILPLDFSTMCLTFILQMRFQPMKKKLKRKLIT